MPLFPPLYWQIFSIIALVLVVVSWIIYHARASRYPLNIFLGTMVALIAALAIWVKAGQGLADYRHEALLDLLLLLAIGAVLVDFVLLTMRACAMRVPEPSEFTLLTVLGIAGLIGAVYLYAAGTQEEAVMLDDLVNRLLQPAWLLVIVIFVVRFARPTVTRR